MFDTQSYLRVLTSINAALTTLLGSVGIFVSLTVQRRVERLQDILEEFLDLSYQSDTNITGKMYKLIEKYQMHYLFPDTPGRLIVQYINLTIAVVIISWVSILTIGFQWTFKVSLASILFYILPIFMGLGILVFYRYLLKNTIYPFGNYLMSPLIPPPVMLRSVSFLSGYVNVSVKSIMKQARLRLLIKPHNSDKAKVVLKEELSFDDYFYYLFIAREDKPVFIGYGDLRISFDNESITGKPIPAAKNVNIPLGYIPFNSLKHDDYDANFFIFPKGEKHPLEYLFKLKKQGNIYAITEDPESSVNYMITYHIDKDRFRVLEENTGIPFFHMLTKNTILNSGRYACNEPFKPENAYNCAEDVYID
ncbi:hypothetical protein [Phosphitispora sp. TUW77]|uniref:hypothetical protein n=1 Tax=Phosphitispora sp. TUW77 TaxID=3152361 RepID=UPI003AB7805F